MTVTRAAGARFETGRAAGGYRHPRPAQLLVGDPVASPVGASYRVCRRVNAAHGRTYYFATRFLPADRRRHVHALYAFARYADDLVDHFGLTWSPAQRRAALQAWSDDVLAALTSGRASHPVLVAVVRTIDELGIRHDDLRAFLHSMAMDLEVTRYATRADLDEYTYGSAAVIGSMMLPVLGSRHAGAREYAMKLGVAFQLTNFLRDVAEDWDRGRIYLPLEDLERFGVTEWDFHARHVGARFRRLLAYEIDRTRTLYREAEGGWAMLDPASQACVRIAHRLYCGILDALERADYQVFSRRAVVPRRRKASVAVTELLRPARPSPPPAWAGEPGGD